VLNLCRKRSEFTLCRRKDFKPVDQARPISLRTCS
jgi:hypothetical protein